MHNLFPQEPDPQPIKSTHLQYLYALFIEDQLDTVRKYQEMISILITIKEGSEFYGETWQRCDVYLREEKIYLGRAVKELAELRDTAKGFSQL